MYPLRINEQEDSIRVIESIKRACQECIIFIFCGIRV